LIEQPADAKTGRPILRKPYRPLGNEYSYSTGGQAGYELVSMGADGKTGGEGDSADISSSD
jgi:general secretion pathway protein G